MDEFFAAVEKLDSPHLRGKPLLIGGDPKRRGVVSTASYEAREFGCRSAMPMAAALRLCPQAIVLPVRGERYHQLSEQMHQIFLRFTPLVEPISIDEAFLDVTGCQRLFGPADKIARHLKQATRDELHLTASVGVAPNKFLAKLASDLEKPDGLTVITEDNLHDVLDPLPVSKLWGVGPAAEKQLARLNIRAIGQLRSASAELLKEHLGEAGEHYQRLASGIDNRPVTPDSRAKSISQEQTFAQDVGRMDELRRVLLDQVQNVSRRLRRHGLKAQTVTLKLRYGDFTTISRSRALDEPTDVTDELWQAARSLFDTWANKDRRPLRLLGMGASQISGEEGSHRSLFEPPGRERQQRIDRAMDDITGRFGRRAIRRGTGSQ